MRSLVLIVDDHAIIRTQLRSLFEAVDVEVCEAINGAEGVKTARERKPSLVILDLSMPVMNGLDAARVLKCDMPLVPLLMFTNNSGSLMENEARSAGIIAVVLKSEFNSGQQLVAQARTILGLDGTDVQLAS